MIQLVGCGGALTRNQKGETDQKTRPLRGAANDEASNLRHSFRSR